jgi:hypothetical protein
VVGKHADPLSYTSASTYPPSTFTLVDRDTRSPDIEVMISTQVVVLLATSGVAVVSLTNPVCKSRSVDHWRSQTGTQSPRPQVRVNVSNSQRSQDPHKIQMYI